MFKQLALSSAMLLASLISPAAQAAPIVSLVASAPSVTVGSNFTVSLRIEGVTDLFGWDADLNFGHPRWLVCCPRARAASLAGTTPLLPAVWTP